MLRELQMPPNCAESLQVELQRTLLAIHQTSFADGIESIRLLGSDSQQLAELSEPLRNGLEMPVEVVDLAQEISEITADSSSALSSAVLLPMAGLALEEAAGVAPPVDLLHPRKRPNRNIAIRTYALAAAAMVALCMLLGWSGYSKLQAPLQAATHAETSLKQLEDELVELREETGQATDIRAWLAQSANLLDELDKLSESARPQPLDAEDFPVEQDVVLSRLNLDNRRLTFEAVARSTTSMWPFEQRVRNSGRDIQRDRVDRNDQLPEYPWQFKATLDLSKVAAPRTGGPKL